MSSPTPVRCNQGDDLTRPTVVIAFSSRSFIRNLGTRGRRAAALFLCASASLSIAACARLVGARPLVPGALKPGDSYHTLTVGTQARTYLLHLPSSYGRKGETPMPVLIVLHGSVTNGSWIA